MSNYTLVIPTYNRPADLGRLLRSLQAQGAKFPILVLDSSAPDSRDVNRKIVSGSSLSIRYLEFDVETPPFDKFWKGVTAVETPFCSMCADDDVVIVPSLHRIVEALSKDSSIAVAHGWYFTFYLTDHLGLTSVVYRGESVTGSPVERIRHLLRSYEALTYGVYRTETMERVLDLVRVVPSILVREVGAGVMTMVHGSAVRLPLLYYGRALGASQNYSEWHPIEFLLGSPATLFREYDQYRSLLIDEMRSQASHNGPERELERMIDLFHLRYLADYVSPKVLDHMIDQLMEGRDRASIMQGVWPLLQPEPAGLWDILRAHPIARKLRSGIGRRISFRLAPKAQDEVLLSPTVSGAERTSRLYPALLEALADLPDADGRSALLTTMSTYE